MRYTIDSNNNGFVHRSRPSTKQSRVPLAVIDTERHDSRFDIVHRGMQEEEKGMCVCVCVNMNRLASSLFHLRREER